MFGMAPFRRNHGLAKKPQDLFDVKTPFGNFFDESFFPDFYHHSNQMKVDIKENEKEFIVAAELPGIRKEEIKLEVTDDRLTIAVEKKEIIDDEQENYIRKERKDTAVSRSFYIDNVEHDDVTAKFEDGILTIILPKKEQVQTIGKKIDIM